MSIFPPAPTRHLGPLFLCMAAFGNYAAVAEPAFITNGADPTRGLVTRTLVEQWRTGGEDDEVFFGSVASVHADADGKIYLLDGQLSQVSILDPDGELIRVIGGEGEGPGEMRRPTDMFISADGTVYVLQGFPGKIIKLHPDGTPAGGTTYSQGEVAEGQFAVMVRGLADPAGMILAGIRMSFGGAGGATSKQEYFLSRCDADGRQLQELLGKEHTINYNAFELDELAMDFVWTGSRLAISPDHQVYAAPDRDRYAVMAYGSDGLCERVITREFESPPRTDHQKQVAHKTIEAVGANYPTPPRRITVADTEPCIGGMWVTSDGRLWVQSSRADLDPPENCFVTLDVFDPEGRFEQQVALVGDHDITYDALNILPDGRVVVVNGALQAFLNQQGTGEGAAIESTPLEVICYVER